MGMEKEPLQELQSPDVASLLGISQDLFSKLWQVRQQGYPKLFPEPIRIIGRSYIWDRSQVEQWKADQQY